MRKIPQLKHLVSFGFVFIIFIFVLYYMYSFIIPNVPVYWDEAAYLLASYKVYTALQNLNTSVFWKETINQYTYPPLQSWTIAFPLLLAKFSIYGARLIQVILFTVGAVVLFFLGRYVSPKQFKNSVGLISLLFYLLSPIIIFMGSLAFKEIGGAALSTFTVLTYLYARDKPDRPILYLIPGLFLTFLMFYKYNYGSLALFGFAIEAAISVIIEKNKKRLIVGHAVFFTTFGLIFGSWILVQGPRIFTDYFFFKGWINYLGEIKPNLINIILFYPRSIYYFYAFSKPAGVILLLGLILTFFHARDYKIRTLFIISAFVIFYYTVFWPHNLQERYLFTVIPLIFVMTSFVLVYYVSKFYQKIEKYSFIKLVNLTTTLFILLYLFICIINLPVYLPMVASYIFKAPVFGQTDFNDNKLWFNYNESDWPQKLPKNKYEKPSDVMDFIVDNIDSNKPSELIGQTNEFSPPLFSLYKKLKNISHQNMPINPDFTSYVITIELLPGSILAGYDYRIQNAYMEDLIISTKSDTELTLVAQKDFSSLKARATILGKK